MKNIFILISVALMLYSCNDFLDSENLTDKTTENFPATEKEADEMLTGIYAHLLFESPETSSEYYIAQLAADDCLGGNLSFSNNCATNFLMYKDNLNGFLDMWARDYTLINRANNAILSFKNVQTWSSTESENRHYGEAHFLRAVAYYELAQVFGGVPIRTNLEATNIPRASVDSVYSLIASDLKKAIELLPNKIYTAGSDMAGHATRAAAQGYMARVFLFYTGRYNRTELPGGITKDQVIKWVDDCVYNSGHELVNDQRNIWSYTNPATENNEKGYRYKYVEKNHLSWVGNSSVETLFANKHNMKSDWTYTWFTNTCAQFFSPSGDNYSQKDSYPFGTGWGAGPVSPAMVEEWKQWSNNQKYLDDRTEDPRLTGSIWSYKALDPNTTGKVLLDSRLDEDEPEYTVSYRYFEQTGYFQKKYININSYDGSSFVPFSKQMFPNISNQTSQSLLNVSDLIHMRFADVLLMQSELKGDNEGLNRVRARSGLAPIAYSLEAIKSERRWELCFEGLRWWDLLRWSGPSLNEAAEALNKQNNFKVINAAVLVPMVKFDYGARLRLTEGYWPIPQDEIDISNGVVKQNPGWDASAQFNDWTKL